MEEQLSFFEYTPLDEYFFLISPDAKIKADLEVLKKQIHGHIGLSDENLYSMAHISLFKLLNPRKSDEELILMAKSGLKNIKSFSIQLKDTEIFHHGPHRRTLTFKIINPELINQIYALFGSKIKLSHKKITPHLTIVKSISTQDLEKIIHDSSLKLHYEAEFTCESILILKRQVIGEKVSAYELVKEVFFGE